MVPRMRPESDNWACAGRDVGLKRMPSDTITKLIVGPTACSGVASGSQETAMAVAVGSATAGIPHASTLLLLPTPTQAQTSTAPNIFVLPTPTQTPCDWKQVETNTFVPQQ